MKRIWIIVGMAVAVLAAAWLVHARQQAAQVNVLLITLDTTRADRLGCYGYADAETPALDSLAGRGVRFTQAFAHAPLTLPSHATILSGLLPPEHGLHDNGRNSLPAGVVTLPQLFRQRNYQTGAFVASFVLDRQFGLDRGFDVYADQMTNTAAGSLLDLEVPAGVVTDRALAWLDQHANRPFFCWVHIFDPHSPYNPPEPYRSRHAHPYDGEIAYMDSQVKRILDFLDARGLRQRTLVVVAGDHGEAFGEHRENGHGDFVYDTTMHVPLILSLPGRIPEGKREDRLVGLSSVAGTILRALRWPLAPGMQRTDLLAPSGDAAAYGESEFLHNSNGWAPLYSLTTPQWKYIACPEPELYDRLRDPAEQTNLAAANPQVAAPLAAQLDALRRGFRTAAAEKVVLDTRAVAKLQSLGYLGGSTPATNADHRALQDAKAMIAVHQTCLQAEGLLARQQPQEAVRLLLTVLPRSPESKKLRELLITGYTDLGDFAAAEPHVRTCLEREPADRAMWVNLGSVLLEKRQFKEAAEVLTQVAGMPRDVREPVVGPSRVSRVDVETQVKLGIACLYQQQLDQARTHYERALRDAPDHFMASEGLAHVAVLQGRADEAIAWLRRMLQGTPDAGATRKNLAGLLAARKEYAAAVQEWREGLRRKSGDTDFLLNLAWCLATCPDAKVRNGSEAVTLAMELCKAAGANNATALDVLAAAHAEAGDYPKAVETARQALLIVTKAGQGNDQARPIEERLKLYEAAKPFRQE